MPLCSRPYGFNKKKFYLPKPVHLFVPCGKGRPKGGKPLPGSGKIVLFKQKRRIGSRTAASPRRDPVPRFKSCKICVAPYRNEPPKKRSFFTKTDRLSVYGATLYPRPEKAARKPYRQQHKLTENDRNPPAAAVGSNSR